MSMDDFALLPLIARIAVSTALVWYIYDIINVWRRGLFDRDYALLLLFALWGLVGTWATGLLLWLSILSAVICVVALCVSMLLPDRPSGDDQAAPIAEPDPVFQAMYIEAWRRQQRDALWNDVAPDQGRHHDRCN